MVIFFLWTLLAPESPPVVLCLLLDSISISSYCLLLFESSWLSSHSSSLALGKANAVWDCLKSLMLNTLWYVTSTALSSFTQLVISSWSFQTWPTCLPLLNLYWVLWVTFLSFMCLKMDSERTCLLIFAGAGVRLTSLWFSRSYLLPFFNGHVLTL